LQDNAALLSKWFPDSIVLPVVGNHDNKYANEATTADEKDNYYNMLYDAWFTNMKGNVGLLKSEELKRTFLDGGFYRVDLTKNLVILALDAQYFAKANDPSLQNGEGERQIFWLGAQLSEDKKFIITMHEYPGARY